MMIKQFVLPVAAMLAGTSLLALLGGCQPAGSQPPGGMPPPEVAVVTVEPQSVPVTFQYVGQALGSREVEVRARVTGIILKRNYREGAAVTQGQSMFALDPAPFQVAVARAEAVVASAEARLAQAKRNSARLKPLFEARAASRRDYDDAISAEQVAEADVGTARANVAEARLNLGYARVDAPVTGIAGRAQRSEGNYISGPEVLLTTVSQIDPIYVLFGVSDEARLKLSRETEAGRLTLPKEGRFEVAVKLADGSTYNRTGTVNFSDVRVSGNTGTSEARAALPNPAGSLRPGEFVRVTLKGAHRPAALLVPQRAVLEGPKGKFVYVVNDKSQIEQRPIEVGDWLGDAWVVTAGLGGGERVVVDGVMKIGPGAPVTVASSGAGMTSGDATPPSKGHEPTKGAGDGKQDGRKPSVMATR